MITPNAAISITQLNDIEGNLANTNILAVVGNGPGNVQTTQRTTIGNIANLIFSTGTVANAITAQTVSNAAQPNITSVGTLANLTVSGNALFLNVNAGNNCQAINLIGDGGNITGVQAAQIVGAVLQSITAQTVTMAAQPNITSVGTLISLTAHGNVTLGNNVGKVIMNTPNPIEINGTAVQPTTPGNITITDKLPVVINGVTYYIALTTAV